MKTVQSKNERKTADCNNAHLNTVQSSVKVHVYSVQ